MADVSPRKLYKHSTSLPNTLDNEESDEDNIDVPSWAEFDNIRDALATQSDEAIAALFKSDLFHPSIEKFMQMSAPIAQRFNVRTDSADWTHLQKKATAGKTGKTHGGPIPIGHVERTNLSKQWALKDFELGRTLGKGRFATVYLAREKTTGVIVVLKVIYKAVLAKFQAERALRSEIEIQAHMNHPNIVKIYGYFYDDDRIYLVLEYAMHGDIFNDVQLCRLDEETSANYISQVAKAIQYMHENFVIHRDIKLENVYLNDRGVIKIGDFGWACHKHNLKGDSVVGTLHYMAPEMLSEEEYDYKVDIWAMGVLLFEMLVGELPFYGADDQELETQILSGPIKLPGYLSAPAADILKRLLDRNPDTRISILEILSHPWIREHTGVKSLKHLTIQFIRETQPLYHYDTKQLPPKLQHQLQTDSVHHRFFSE